MTLTILFVTSSTCNGPPPVEPVPSTWPTPGATDEYAAQCMRRAAAGAEYIGYDGNGVFTQSGGTHTVPVPMYLGYNADGNGTYNLNSGSLFAASEYVGYSGSGTFTQSGGTHTVSSAYYIIGNGNGSNGTYNLGGGSLSCPGQGTRRRLRQRDLLADGRVQRGPGDRPRLERRQQRIILLDSRQPLLPDDRNRRRRRNWLLHAMGGSNTCWLIVGDGYGSNGTYQLNGGQLSTLYEAVGDYGTGMFVQWGGTNAISTYALYLGAGGNGSTCSMAATFPRRRNTSATAATPSSRRTAVPTSSAAWSSPPTRARGRTISTADC